MSGDNSKAPRGKVNKVVCVEIYSQGVYRIGNLKIVDFYWTFIGLFIG